MVQSIETTVVSSDSVGNKISSPKPKIQVKLENWEKPSLTHDSVVAKLVEASERRSMVLSHQLQKASQRSNAVKDMHIQKEDERMALEKRLNDKLSRMSENRENMTKEMVENLANKNLEKEQKALRVKEESQAAAVLLEKQMNEKVDAAVQRKNEVIVGKVPDSEKKREMVSKVHEESRIGLKLKLDEKLAKTSEARETMTKEMVENLANKNLEKEQKALRVKEEAEAAAVLLEKQINEKVDAAAQRKNEVIVSKLPGSEKKRETMSKVHEESRNDLKLKLDGKLMKTSEARENMTKEMVENLANKNLEKEQKALRVKEESQAAAVLLEKQINEKVDAAVQRKNEVIVGKVPDSEKKREMVSKVHEENRIGLKLKLDEKLAKTSEARETMTKEMVDNLILKNKEKEERAHRVKEEAEAAVILLAKQVNEKVAAATQRKNDAMHSRVFESRKIQSCIKI